MIGTDMNLLNSKFLAYDPATKAFSNDFGKFLTSRVVFIKDAGPTAVLHNLCRELFLASVKGPSCLLLGRIPNGMSLASEDIPGWNDLPDDLHIEGIDNTRTAAKHAILNFLHYEAQRIHLVKRRLLLQAQVARNIAHVLKENTWQKTEAGNIRVDLDVYARIKIMYQHDDWMDEDRGIMNQLTTIEDKIKALGLQSPIDQNPEERMQHLLERIAHLSTRFPKIFVLLPEELFDSDTDFYQQLRERKLEPVVLTPNAEYTCQIDEELGWLQKRNFRQITIDTVWQEHEKVYDKTTNTYRRAHEIEELDVVVLKSCLKDFPVGIFIEPSQESGKRLFSTLDSSAGDPAQGDQEKKAKQRTAEKHRESAAPSSPVDDQTHGKARHSGADVCDPADEAIGSGGSVFGAKFGSKHADQQLRSKYGEAEKENGHPLKDDIVRH